MSDDGETYGCGDVDLVTSDDGLAITDGVVTVELSWSSALVLMQALGSALYGKS